MKDSEVKRENDYWVKRHKYEQEELLNWTIYGANNGDVELQYQLGQKYLIGDGVEKNLEESLRWLKMSYENGYEGAKKYI